MNNAKILAIDDDDMVLVYLKKTLGERYTMIATTQPQSAVRLAASEQPDLIICDIDMPEMSGGEVCAALAKNPATAHIPFMYLTNIASPGEIDDLGGNVGGRPGVAKRAPLPILVAAIEKLIAPTV